MDQKDVEELLMATIAELQKVSGRPEVTLSRDTSPIDEIPDFDSLNGVEATVEVVERLKLEVDFNNVFVRDDKPLTIRQAAARLCALQRA